MDTIDIAATLRVGTGKSIARKVRKGGQLPAVIYRAGAASASVQIDPVGLEKAFAKTGNPNTLVNLTVDGATRTCLVQAVQRHPLTKVLRHVDFYEVDPNTDVRVRVRLTPVGTSAGQKAGGSLRIIRRHAFVICKPHSIPSAIELDVTPLDIGATVKVSDLVLADGVKVDSRVNFAIVEVIGKKVEGEGKGK